MVEQPSHVRQLSLNHLSKTALKSDNHIFHKQNVQYSVISTSRGKLFYLSFSGLRGMSTKNAIK
jgi:hypothetical protein